MEEEVEVEGEEDMTDLIVGHLEEVSKSRTTLSLKFAHTAYYHGLH